MVKRKRLLITGSGGHIFGNFIRQVFYAKMPYTISSIDRVRESHIHNIYVNQDHQFYIADIRDQHTLHVIFEKERPDIVIHGAAEGCVDKSIDTTLPFTTSNVVGTQNIIDQCLAVNAKLIYMSTDGVYGALANDQVPPWTEESPLNPKNTYCVSGDTEILQSDGTWECIKNISLTNVISVDFSTNKTYSKQCDNISINNDSDTIVDIETSFGILSCSPKHRLFIKRPPRYNKKLDNRNKDCKIKEIQTHELTTDDFIGFLRTDPEPKNTININSEYSRFLGYFVGDGCISLNCRSKSWYIRLADENKERLEFYKDIIQRFSKDLFGRMAKPCFIKHTTKNCWYLSFGSNSISDEIQKYSFNLPARQKKIPDIVFKWSNNAIFEFLAGLIDADGSINYKNNRITYTSASKDLVIGVSKLFRRAGILGKIDSYKSLDTIMWRFLICDTKSIQLFRDKIKSLKQPLSIKSNAHYYLDNDDVIWVKVKKISNRKNTEPLYDISVPGFENFIANGFIVHNSATKAAGELLVRAAANTHGLKYNIVRASNNYGPWQTTDKLIPRIIDRVMTGNEIPIYGKGDQIRDWIHVYDTCAALFKVIDNGVNSEIYNITAKQEFTNLEVAQIVCNALGKGHELLKHVEDRQGHDFRYAMTNDKIKSLGWVPEFKFRDGISQTCQWYVINKFALQL